VRFDEIIENYNIEKIKTVGDSYMCAGGVQVQDKNNPINTVLAGLEMQRFIFDSNVSKKLNNELPWNIRVGINTGEVIAGVVGKKKFTYDIWGDSVNVASRMESGGEVGKVNISGSTYELVKEFFVCTYRGKISAKNKGNIDMYFVEKIKPEYSVNGEGLFPNDDFISRLRSTQSE
jgi:class 3 adenylate cyclase